MFYNIL